MKLDNAAERTSSNAPIRRGRLNEALGPRRERGRAKGGGVRTVLIHL
jgi:hypothetical protein